MIDVNRLGSMGIRPGHREFTIGWGEGHGTSEGSLKDKADAAQVFQMTQDIVSSHSTAVIPDYVRSFYNRPMWSNDLDPSRSSDVRTLEMNGNTYRSQVLSEPGPRRPGLPQGYRKTSFQLSDDANTIEVGVQFEEGKIKSAKHFRRLEDGATEVVSFTVNDNGTLTYESLREQQD